MKIKVNIEKSVEEKLANAEEGVTREDILEQELEEAITNVGAYLKAIGAMLLVTVLTAWVGLQFYNWFIMPFGAMAISFWHAYGLVLLADFLIFKVKQEDKDKTDEELLSEQWYAIKNAASANVIFLLFGFIVQLFM